MPSPDLDFRNINSLWAGVLVETLVRTGARQAVIAPGSRSAPLVFALARHPGIEAISVLDERSAGFFALGLAKRGKAPVILVCTSGTAAANFFPAVIEARESAIPLIVLTADRPPELRDCAAGQAIDQQKLYGGYVNFYHELALPEPGESLFRYLRQTVAHACSQALWPQAGPVHLNSPFRDPLPPIPHAGTAEFAAKIDWDGFFSHLTPPPPARISMDIPELSASVHGLIVAGAAEPDDPAVYAAAVGEISGRLGWPVLADALSPLRGRAASVPHLITTYDAILRQPPLMESLSPESVICLGGWPTSKVLRNWLEKRDPPILLVGERLDNRDALHGRTRHLAIALNEFAACLPRVSEPNGYQQIWSGYDRRVRSILDGRLEAEAALFEPKAAWLMARHLPEDTPIFIASSMPVRDAEFVWPANDRRIRPFFNRGANGIDGTLSTALGVAHGGPPAVLLTGDLALLHDGNGFLIAPKFKGSLTVVLINNHGGGIFEHLPVARFDPPFEEFFATPQEADFGTLCAAHGVEHMLVRDWPHFVELVSSLPAAGIRVVEIRTDRKADAAGRRNLFADMLS